MQCRQIHRLTIRAGKVRAIRSGQWGGWAGRQAGSIVWASKQGLRVSGTLHVPGQWVIIN